MISSIVTTEISENVGLKCDDDDTWLKNVIQKGEKKELCKKLLGISCSELF